MNITEKILARASDQNTVSPDDVIFAKVDKVMIHDVSGPGVIKVFDKLKNQGIDTTKLYDASKFGLQRIILFLQQKKFLQKTL